jgi:hypothetical protein
MANLHDRVLALVPRYDHRECRVGAAGWRGLFRGDPVNRRELDGPPKIESNTIRGVEWKIEVRKDREGTGKPPGTGTGWMRRLRLLTSAGTVETEIPYCQSMEDGT